MIYVSMEFECKKHGKNAKTNLAKGRTRPRCVQCASDAVTKRRRKVKQMAVEYKGGSCVKCGYNKCVRAMQFHHLDPTQKDFGISVSGATRSWERTKAELDKCILVCGNCHSEIHELEHFGE